MDTLNYIIKKYSLDQNSDLPIEIPNAGRNDLAELLHELDFKTGVEVGVARGKYTKRLCGANPQMKIYAIDAWKPYGNYLDYTPEMLGWFYEIARGKLASFSNCEIIKEFSTDAVKKIEDNSLDFVYIDANHKNPYVTEDIIEWSKKVKPGGIVSGHDYSDHRIRRTGESIDVIEAVRKYTNDNNIKPWFVLGLSARTPGVIRDLNRSWFLVKP